MLKHEKWYHVLYVLIMSILVSILTQNSSIDKEEKDSFENLM